MAWIESHQSLSRHRKTLKTAGRLSVDRHKLIGHLHELWWWALDNVGVDGRLTEMTPYEIATAAQWDGNQNDFVEALVDGGFLDRHEDEWVLHDWYDYAGKLIERRLQERERSRQRREQAKENDDESTENEDETTNQRPTVNQRSTVGTVPNRTVPNHTLKDEDHVPEKSGTEPAPYQDIVDMYHNLCPSLSKVIKVNANRKTLIRARLKDRGPDGMKMMFEKAGASSFLNGANDRGWKANFDWLLNDSNYLKVLEGRYDNSPLEKREKVTRADFTYAETNQDRSQFTWLDENDQTNQEEDQA